MSSSDAPWHRLGDLAVQTSDTDVSHRSWSPSVDRHLESVRASEAVRWLAAYALGLAYSSLPDREAVRLLCRATHGRRELALARAQLCGWAVVDASQQQRALRLLATAALPDDAIPQPVGAE